MSSLGHRSHEIFFRGSRKKSYCINLIFTWGAGKCPEERPLIVNPLSGGDYPATSSEPQPGSSRDTGRPPGGGGGGPFEAEASVNLDALAGLKGLDPNAGTAARIRLIT